MDTQSIKEENAALGRILTGDFYRIVWNITTPSYFSRKEANYSVHFSVIWKFFLVVSSRISTLYHVYQRLPLIVEEFDFKFLIEIILTLSFFSLTTLYRMARNSNLANFGTINLHHFRRCFLFKRSSLEHPFEPLRKHDARYDVYAVIALKGHSRSLEYSSAFARVGRRCSSFHCSRLQSKNYFARDWK